MRSGHRTAPDRLEQPLDHRPLVVLVIGVYGDLVTDLLRAHPQHRVLVIEEPDVIGSLSGPWTTSPRVEILAGAYQQCLQAASIGVQWHRREPFHAVIAGREYGVRAAQAIATELGLRGPGTNAAELCTDKLALRRAIAGYGLTQGRFAAVGSPDDIRAFMQDAPVVVKPRARHASLGVVRIERADQIDAAWRAATASHDQGGVTQHRDLAWDYLVEDLVVGCGEFSKESLVRHGEIVFSNVTQKRMTAMGHFSPLGHVLPARLTAEQERGLAQAEQAFLRSAGIRDGLTHSEWIWTATGPHLVECAVRFPGGGLARLIEQVYGLNLADSWVRLLADHTRPTATPPAGMAAVYYLTPDAGRFDGIHGVDALAGLDWVIDCQVTVPVGADVSQLRHSIDRIGHVAVTADSYATLDERLRQVQDLVSAQGVAGSGS